MVFVGLSLFALAAGMVGWRLNGWTLRALDGSGWSAPALALASSVVLLIAFHMCIVFTEASGGYSFVTTTWIFLALEMACVAPAAYLVAGATDVRRTPCSEVARFEREGLLGSNVDLGDPPAVPDAVGGTPAQKARREWLRWRKRTVWALYAGSFVIMVAYAIINAILASSALDSGRVLGVGTAAAVGMLDACHALIHRARIITRPLSLLLVACAARVGLVAFGAQWWFVGHSVVYCIYGIVLGNIAVRGHLSAALERVRRLEEAALRRSPGACARDRGCAAGWAVSRCMPSPNVCAARCAAGGGDDDDGEVLPSFAKRLSSAEGVFVLVTVVFSIEILIVKYVRPLYGPMATCVRV